MKLKPAWPLLLACCTAAPTWAADGVMLRDDALRAKASAASAGLATVEKGRKVDILSRQGGWTQIRTGGRTGWVRILSVRSDAAAGAGGVGDVSALAERRDPNKVVATAGLRGLSEEELRNAQYDAEQMRQLETLAVSPDQARRFAAEGHLSGVKLDYLPNPKAK